MPRTMQKHGPLTTGPECFGDTMGPNTVIQNGARVDASQFPRADRVAVAVGAAAVKGAMQVTVTALTGRIPAGRLIYLTGGKVIRTRLDANATATTIYTQPLEAALVGTETGEYMGSGRITIPAGTALGRTIAERNAGTGFGPADGGGADTEVYLLARTIMDADEDDFCTLYQHNRQVYENFLPGVATMGAGLLTQLRGLYQFLLGA